MIRDPARLVRKKLPKNRDTMIRIFTYMHFALAYRLEKLLHPEPGRYVHYEEEFDISKVDMFHHSAQMDQTTGDVIYEYLKKWNKLKDCLGYVHLLAIQAKGVEFFRQHFAGLSPYAWGEPLLLGKKSKDFYVPYITEIKGKVLILWMPYKALFYSSNPALIFKPNDL